MLAFEWPNSQTVFMIGVFAVPVAALVCAYSYFIIKVRSDNELKRTMVERGMSAEEIERVLAAKSKL